MRLATIIRPAAPFDFDLTAGYHAYFQSRYGTISWRTYATVYLFTAMRQGMA